MRRAVERLFEQALERLDGSVPLAMMSLTQDHPLIRSANEYGDLFSSAAAANADATTTSSLTIKPFYRRAVPPLTMTMPEIDPAACDDCACRGCADTLQKPAWCRPRVPTSHFWRRSV